MAFDADQQTWIQWILTLFLGAGGGMKIVTHEGRIKQLEDSRQRENDRLDDVAQRVSGMDSKLEAVAENVTTIRDLLMGKGLK